MMGAKTNAMRQRDWRTRQRAGQRLLAVGAFGLTGFDEAMLTRLFGPKLALEDAGVAAMVAESFDRARSVECTAPTPGADLVAPLVFATVRHGLGGTPAGWSVSETSSGVRLDAWCFKSRAAAAAEVSSLQPGSPGWIGAYSPGAIYPD